VVQGVGGSMMVPVGRLVILRSVPKAQLVGALAWLTVPALIGPVVGPPVGGFITTYFAWRWIVRINVPVGVAGLALATAYLGALLFRFGVGATPFLLPLLLQIGFGLTPFQSGMITFASAIGAIAMKFVAPPLLRRHGFRTILVLNAVVASAFVAMPATFSPQ